MLGMDVQMYMEVATAIEMHRSGKVSKTYGRLMASLIGLNHTQTSHNVWLFTVLDCITYKADYERNFNRGS